MLLRSFKYLHYDVKLGSEIHLPCTLPDCVATSIIVLDINSK